MSKSVAKALSGHGTFIYDANATIGRYGSPEAVASAVKDLDMQHAWVRIHGVREMHAAEPTRSLIGALQSEGIEVAGWGWCQGEDVRRESRLAVSALNRFGLMHYVADIEQGVSNANWTEDEIEKFFLGLKEGLSDQAQVALSSHAFITWHGPELMKAADPYVDYFAPQVYWFWFPSAKMLKAMGFSKSEYAVSDPGSYIRLCVRLWRDVTRKPLIVTGQAYWGEAQDFTREVAEEKVEQFINGFEEWGSIQGFNWWHLGGKAQDAMSFSIYNKIREAQINTHFRQ